MSSPRYHALKVRSVVQETGDSRSIVFDVPAELSTSFAYRPGQFLTLRLPVNGRRLLRCYSMSSAPGIDPQLQVTVKQVAGGLASNWLCSQVKAGDSIEVMAPAGVFTPRSLTGDLLLFGGGSGITPVYSILRSALKQGTGRIRLIYANRDERSVIFGKELAELGRTHPDRLQVIHWLDSVQGRCCPMAGCCRMCSGLRFGCVILPQMKRCGCLGAIWGSRPRNRWFWKK